MRLPGETQTGIAAMGLYQRPQLQSLHGNNPYLPHQRNKTNRATLVSKEVPNGLDYPLGGGLG